MAFTGGGLGVGLRGNPARVYNSQQSTKLTANSTRLIRLPSSLFSGVVGMIASITVLDAAGSGNLTVFRADTQMPAQPTMRYGTPTMTQQVIVEVSAAGQIKVHTTKAVHIHIDLVGTLS